MRIAKPVTTLAPIHGRQMAYDKGAALPANKAVPATAAKPPRDQTESLIGSDPA